jgi:DNA-binding PadR family transcriptional regulator
MRRSTPKIPSPREVELLRLVITERTGREVAKAYESESGQSIPYSTVYACFADMEKRGWVRIRDEEKGDRRVRWIKIEQGAGVAALNLALQTYGRLARLAQDGLEELT